MSLQSGDPNYMDEGQGHFNVAERFDALSARIEALEAEAKRYRAEFAALFMEVQDLIPGLDASAHRDLRRSSSLVSNPTLSHEGMGRLKTAINAARSVASLIDDAPNLRRHLDTALKILGMDEGK